MSQDNQQAELQSIVNAIRTLAENCQGNNIALLSLLRQLEGLHQEIRDGLFQASLPDNRQALYTLLKDIESQGGWPYIERMRLQALFVNVEPAHNNHKGDETIINIATTPELHNGEATIIRD
ncbi:hypothetical protein [Gloeocapsopsis sp. IPPAS B-1203]|uniref:hypothetical protein n=1 Tax=Gloeocapsopsis sp. IPPAS B-1203 TaxID=2049454 RepID=UPI000C1935DE|nr:hypothetical protein [Gloeocapsopsis sp. IPPAS B-1203]PIG91037.1 hypothetical protein CSQ79_23705 [Gloeocapsopsis sp. IPPAS B-1203]